MCLGWRQPRRSESLNRLPIHRPILGGDLRPGVCHGSRALFFAGTPRATRARRLGERHKGGSSMTGPCALRCLGPPPCSWCPGRLCEPTPLVAHCAAQRRQTPLRSLRRSLWSDSGAESALEAALEASFGARLSRYAAPSAGHKSPDGGPSPPPSGAFSTGEGQIDRDA